MANIEFWTFSLAPWSERMCVCCCCCVQHNSPHHLLGSLLLTYHRLDKKLLIFSYSRGHNFTHILFYYIGYLITQKNASNLGQSKMFEIFVNNQRIWLNSCSKFGYEEYHLVADQLDFCSLKLNKKISNVECIINSKRFALEWRTLHWLGQTIKQQRSMLAHNHCRHNVAYRHFLYITSQFENK